MRWKQRDKPPRPEYPKAVRLAGTYAEEMDRLEMYQAEDPDATITDLGERGVFVRVHNERAEVLAKTAGEPKTERYRPGKY